MREIRQFRYDIMKISTKEAPLTEDIRPDKNDPPETKLLGLKFNKNISYKIDILAYIATLSKISLISLQIEKNEYLNIMSFSIFSWNSDLYVRSARFLWEMEEIV